MRDIIEVTDIADPVFDVYSRHNETKLYRYYEPDAGLFIAESVRVIARALDAGYEPVSLLLETSAMEKEASAILQRVGDIPVYTAGQKTLEQITGYPVTRGALSAMRRRTLLAVDTICADTKRIAVLHHIMNPTNVGAIFRNAAALNVDAVLLLNGCADPLYRRAIRVSMGNVFSIPWTVCEEQEALACLKKEDFTCYALGLREDAVSLSDVSFAAQEKTALFLGSENDGLSDTIMEACDAVVMIPMAHGVDSLNVAAASAVAFFCLAGN